MFGTLPEEIEGMLKTLQEMYNGSVPDEGADYFELRQQIEEHIYSLKVVRTNIQQVGAKYSKQENEVQSLIEESKEPTDTVGLEKLKEAFEHQKTEIDKILEEAEACNDNILDIKNQLGQCLIPENITKRANEIDSFKEKLVRI